MGSFIQRLLFDKGHHSNNLSATLQTTPLAALNGSNIALSIVLAIIGRACLVGQWLTCDSF